MPAQQQQNKKREIEILPWVHDIKFTFHKDLIRYLKTLPKGSTIFFEITRGNLFYFEAALREIKTIDPKSIADNKWAATFEFLATCLFCGHKIIPLESDSLDRTKSKIYFTSLGPSAENVDQIIAVNRLREKTFVRNINREHINTGYVVCGLAHAEPIREALEQTGYVAKVNMNFFTHRKDVEELQRIHPHEIKAIKYRQTENLERLRRRKERISANNLELEVFTKARVLETVELLRAKYSRQQNKKNTRQRIKVKEKKAKEIAIRKQQQRKPKG